MSDNSTRAGTDHELAFIIVELLSVRLYFKQRI